MMVDASKMAAVVTQPFFAKSPDTMERALREILELPIGLAVLVHDRKSSARGYAFDAFREYCPRFEVEGKSLSMLEVDVFDTAVRWRPGVVEALKGPEVGSVFLFPGDMKVKDEGEPITTLRAGWRKMVEAAGPTSLIIGQYESRDRFKTEFDSLIAHRAVEILFDGLAEGLGALALTMMRSEFLVVGREVFEHFDTGLRHFWGPDPTPQLLLSTLTHREMRVEQVWLGEFADDPGTRSALGQMHQIFRFIAELAIDRMVRDKADTRTVTEEIETYDRTRADIEVLFQETLRALDENRQALV